MVKTDKAKMLIGMSNTLLFSRIVANGAWDIGVVLYVLSLLFMVGVIGFCKKRECMWLFVFNLVGSIPINLVLAKELSAFFASDVPVIGTILAYIEVYLIILSLEQLFLGILGRIIWKKQICVGEESAEWEELY